MIGALTAASLRGSPLSATPAPTRQRSQAMAGIPAEPPRGDRRVRFFHRADVDVPAAVLLLCHRARAPQDPTLQRDPSPDSGLGRPTTARGLSGSWPIPLCDP